MISYSVYHSVSNRSFLYSYLIPFMEHIANEDYAIAQSCKDSRQYMLLMNVYE